MNRKHKIIWAILRPLVAIVLFFKFGYRYEKLRNLPDNYIVLANHVTDWDPLLVAVSFPKQMYFVASEHIARWDRWYKLIDFLLQPILRRKGTAALSTVKEILNITRKGGSVAVFAEGERSWDGLTGSILPSTGKMVKNSRCGLITYKLEGGYFVSPRWSTSLRKGHLCGVPVNIYTKEQLAEMTTDQINEIIVKDLYEDAYEKQLVSPVPYKGKNLAEGMENFLFLCPECQEMDSMTSHGDTVKCSACGHSFRYTEYGMLEGTKFETIRDLSAWQNSQVTEGAEKGIEYKAVYGRLVKVENHQETFVSEGSVSMNSEKLICGTQEFLMKDISELAIHGKRGIVFSIKKEYYELKPAEGSNAYKFVLLYNAYKNLNSKR